MKKPIKEIAMVLLTALPVVYFFLNYDHLPKQIPVHYNFEGLADSFSEKSNFIWFILAFNVGPYLLMMIIPKLDPKNRIKEMGEKYIDLRMMMTFIFSVIMCYLIYVVVPGNSFIVNALFGILALLFAMFGNYFQTIRPNYFIGIRTPWTLESEDNWKITHRRAGRLWMIGGSLLFILAFLLNKDIYTLLFAVTIAIMVLYPIILSYRIHRKSSKNTASGL